MYVFSNENDDDWLGLANELLALWQVVDAVGGKDQIHIYKKKRSNSSTFIRHSFPVGGCDGGLLSIVNIMMMLYVCV